MQVNLTTSDLAAMPTALRQDLLAYLAMRRKPFAKGPTGRRRETAAAGPFDGLAVLDRDQAMTLVRDVSFGRNLKGLHDLLETLSYEKDGDAPGPERLARLLKLDDIRGLRRYFDAIRRLLRQVTREIAPLLRYSHQTLSSGPGAPGGAALYAGLECHRHAARSYGAAGAPDTAALGQTATHRLFPVLVTGL